MSLVLLRSPSPEKEEEVLAPTERGKAPTFWCALYREDGSLEVCAWVCGEGEEGRRGGRGNCINLCTTNVYVISCTSHACTDLSNTKIQTCVFCEKLFVCSQDSYGQWTCTITKVIHMAFM